MHEWSELIRLWEHDQVTATQVIGQLLKHGEANHKLMMAFQRRFEQLEQLLPPQADTPPPTTGKPLATRR